ncbi:MAG: hypothetical protein EHM91_11565 [Planctomycetota bacterium]|nr:MAG: hypothetical protein EHM91_11565 [Planctomycetota bacterium]
MKRAVVLTLMLAGCASGPSEKEKEAARIDRQLAELYRPLALLVEESRVSVQDFLKKEARIQIMPTDRTLTDAELQRWIEKAEKDLMPRNDKMCALIRSKKDLVEGGTLPKSWQALLEHQDGWREDHDRWRKEGVAYPFHARTSFPRLLEKELKASIAALEERKAALAK